MGRRDAISLSAFEIGFGPNQLNDSSRMATRRKLIVLFALGTLAGVIGTALWMHRTHSPDVIYNGKPLRAWLREFNGNPDGTETEQARTAVLVNGTNGIPTLLEMFREHDSPLMLRLVELTRRWRWLQIDYVDSRRRQLQAVNAFSVLGSNAVSAVPALVAIYKENLLVMKQPHGASQAGITVHCTSVALGCIGPAAKDAVPALLEGTTNSDLGVRIEAIRALGEIHSEPGLAMPFLIAALKDSATEPGGGDGSVQWWAVNTVARYGTDAAPAIPTLLGLLSSTNSSVALDSMLALAHADPGDAIIMPILIRALGEANPSTHMAAVRAVAILGPRAKAAAPALVKLLARHPEGHNKESIKRTLKQIDPTAAAEAGIQ